MSDLRRSLEHDLERLRTDLVRLAAMVNELIPRGTLALLSSDLGEAKAVIDADERVDALTLDVEDRCCQILALRHPVASDLRAVVTAIHLVSEIERCADLMVNIAKGTRRMYGVEFDPRVRGLIEQLSESSSRLFRQSIDAYADRNAGLAVMLTNFDDRIDGLHARLTQSIFEAHRHGRLDLEAGVQLALVGRYYARIGDHAVNIGDRVNYMVTGRLPRFQYVSPPLRVIDGSQRRRL